VKENIVQKALLLFLKYGFKTATMDDIAQEMGVSKKTIYNHFPTKENLVRECAQEQFQVIMEDMIRVTKHSKDPIIELYQLKKEALKHLSGEKNSPHYQLQKYYPSIHNHLKEKEFEILGGFFAQSIQKGIEMGLFRKSINVNFVTRIFFNGIRGITDIGLFPPQQYEIDQLMIAFSEYHLRAICSAEGTAKLEYYKKEMNL
jgi:AcrR family transcriptional regulator